MPQNPNTAGLWAPLQESSRQHHKHQMLSCVVPRDKIRACTACQASIHVLAHHDGNPDADCALEAPRNPRRPWPEGPALLVGGGPTRFDPRRAQAADSAQREAAAMGRVAWPVRRLLLAAVLAVVLGSEPDFQYAGECDVPGELCIITRSDDPLRSPKVNAEASLAFLSIGDWGCGEDNCAVKADPAHMQAGPTQAKVALAMGMVGEEARSELVLALGDNFYFSGVRSAQDPLWNSVWQSRFTHPALQTPWYALLGNHDHYGNPQAQIDFSLMGFDRRWVLPSYYWSTEKAVGSSGRVVQWIMIDTVLLDEAYARSMLLEKIKSEVVGSEQLAWFDGRAEQRRAAGEEQLRWLEETLAASTADVLIVAGHFPVLSGGEHGSTQSLLAAVQPLLEKYGVDAYLSGHDHTLQHLEAGGVQYYVSGNACLRGAVRPLPETRFAAVAPGFALHQVECRGAEWQHAAAPAAPAACTLTTTFFDATARALYQHTVRGRRGVRAQPAF